MALNVALAANELAAEFARARFASQKNFISLPSGELLLEAVLRANRGNLDEEHVCVIPKHQIGSEPLKKIENSLREFGLEINFVGAPRTRSAFSSLLWASDFFRDDVLRVIPGDAIVRTASAENQTNEMAPYLVSARSTEDRWGFLEVDGQAKLISVEPKNPISDIIAAGEYVFENARDLISLSQSIFMDAQSRDPHLAQALKIIAGGSPIKVKAAAEFIPLASPGDVRAFGAIS